MKIECVYFMNCRKKILSFAFFMNIAAQCFFWKLKITLKRPKDALAEKHP